MTFRRAGRVFTSEATEIDAADLSPDQIESLRREGDTGGMLEVTGLPAAPTASTAGSPSASANAPTLGGHGSASPSKAEIQSSGVAGALEHEAERHSGKRR